MTIHYSLFKMRKLPISAFSNGKEHTNKELLTQHLGKVFLLAADSQLVKFYNGNNSNNNKFTSTVGAEKSLFSNQYSYLRRSTLVRILY
jgi:hypothetical protein